MYKQPNNNVLRGLQTGAPYLAERATWIHQNVFEGKEKAKLKIERALQTIDALWTGAERKAIIHHELSDLDAIRLFENIARRVVAAAHVLKVPTPRTATPSA